MKSWNGSTKRSGVEIFSVLSLSFWSEATLYKIHFIDDKINHNDCYGVRPSRGVLRSAERRIENSDVWKRFRLKGGNFQRMTQEPAIYSNIKRKQ